MESEKTTLKKEPVLAILTREVNNKIVDINETIYNIDRKVNVLFGAEPQDPIAAQKPEEPNVFIDNYKLQSDDLNSIRIRLGLILNKLDQNI